MQIRNLLLLFPFLFLCSSSHAQKPSRPNIILIVADDLGYGDLGCYGQQKIKTPHLDQLAKDGIRFTHFYAGTSVCAPSRASLMTGKHTGHTSVRGNKGTKPEGQFPLEESDITFPMQLQKNGYRTAAFGKWGLGYITTSGDPNKKGFDQFFGYNCQSLAHNYYPDHLWKNHERIELPGNLKNDSLYSADFIHQEALRFLNAQGSQPFFLFLPYTLPHADVIVPHDSIYQYYVRQFAEQPVQVKSNDKETHHFDPYPHAAFAAMVTRLDRYVGEILASLKEKGLDKNTLVLFTSDNGPHRENGGDPEFFNSSGGLHGIKRDLYEGGIRVPFIAYRKGMTRGGALNSAPLAFYDLYPTILQLAGIPPGKGIDGESFLPALLGKKTEGRHYFYWEFHERGGSQAVLMGNYKAIRLNLNQNENAPIELYDLRTDPAEKNDISASHPDLVKQALKYMKEAHVHNPSWPLLSSEIK